MIERIFGRKIKLIIMVGLVLTLCACGTQSQSASKSSVDFEKLTKTGSMELLYASSFSVDEYGEYRLINVVDDSSYILVPEGSEVPYNLPDNTVVLKQPLDKTYLVSTSVMDLVRQLDALDSIRLSGQTEKDWYIEEAKEAMNKGNIIYAGKYSAPDYELILSEDCNLAIENTMIYHNPEVKEKLEELNIPVLVEKSSYETHPLGRLEWIKLYGVLFGKEKEAEEYFSSQTDKLQSVIQSESTGKTVAFFYVNSNGAVNVRKPNDYISQMIELAGGSYVLKDLVVEEENALSTLNMQMEDFYAQAIDADIIIYNSTIDGELTDINSLLEKSMLFKDFKAVKEGQVYCTSKNFFQESTGVAEFMVDVNKVLNNNEDDFVYLKKLR